MATFTGSPRPFMAGVFRTACKNCVRSKRRCGGGNPCEQCEMRDISCAYAPRRMSGPRRRCPRRSHSAYLREKTQLQSPTEAVAEQGETAVAAMENNQKLWLLQQQVIEESHGNRSLSVLTNTVSTSSSASGNIESAPSEGGRDWDLCGMKQSSRRWSSTASYIATASSAGSVRTPVTESFSEYDDEFINLGQKQEQQQQQQQHQRYHTPANRVSVCSSLSSVHTIDSNGNNEQHVGQSAPGVTSVVPGLVHRQVQEIKVQRPNAPRTHRPTPHPLSIAAAPPGRLPSLLSLTWPRSEVAGEAGMMVVESLAPTACSTGLVSQDALLSPSSNVVSGNGVLRLSFVAMDTSTCVQRHPLMKSSSSSPGVARLEKQQGYSTSLESGFGGGEATPSRGAAGAPTGHFAMDSTLECSGSDLKLCQPQQRHQQQYPQRHQRASQDVVPSSLASVLIDSLQDEDDEQPRLSGPAATSCPLETDHCQTRWPRQRRFSFPIPSATYRNPRSVVSPARYPVLPPQAVRPSADMRVGGAGSRAVASSLPTNTPASSAVLRATSSSLSSNGVSGAGFVPPSVGMPASTFSDRVRLAPGTRATLGNAPGRVPWPVSGDVQQPFGSFQQCGLDGSTTTHPSCADGVTAPTFTFRQQRQRRTRGQQHQHQQPLVTLLPRLEEESRPRENGNTSTLLDNMGAPHSDGCKGYDGNGGLSRNFFFPPSTSTIARVPVSGHLDSTTYTERAAPMSSTVGTTDTAFWLMSNSDSSSAIDSSRATSHIFGPDVAPMLATPCTNVPESATSGSFTASGVVSVPGNSPASTTRARQDGTVASKSELWNELVDLDCAIFGEHAHVSSARRTSL